MATDFWTRIAGRLLDISHPMPVEVVANSGVDIGDVDVKSLPADPLGANADAIVAAGAVGSLSAKMRRITQGLEDLKTLLVLAAGTAHIGEVDIGVIAQAPIPAETVVAGNSSTLGKWGTIAAGRTEWARVPCAVASPATSLAVVTALANKDHTLYFARARTILEAPTITLAAAQANDTVIVNGLTFTAHATTTTTANREFKIDGATDTLDADELVLCLLAAFANLGITAAAPAAVTTLTADPAAGGAAATSIQAVTGVGGARIVCAQTFPLPLSIHRTVSGLAANNTTDGVPYEIDMLGYPHLYVGIKNNDSLNAMTAVIRATILP